MKKSLLLLAPLILSANSVQNELIEAIEKDNVKKVIGLVNSKKIDINEPNINCETPLDSAFERFEKAEIENIDSVLSIISVLQTNGARRNITPLDFENCFLVQKEKEKLRVNKTPRNINDYTLIQEQLKLQVNKDLLTKEKLTKQFYTALKPIIDEFNASLFVADGNYFEITQDNTKIYSNFFIEIADWKEVKSNYELPIDNEKLEVLLSIDTKKFAENLDNLFKNKDFLFTIQNEKNKLLKKLSLTDNKLLRKEIQNKIKRYEKSFSYIVDKSVSELKKFKTVISK